MPEILTLSEASVLATLLPQQPVTLRALRAMLFDGELRNSLSDTAALLFGVLRKAQSISYEGAQRGLLRNDLEEAVMQEARASGKTKREVKETMRSDPVSFGRLVAAVVDAHGIQDAVKREEVLGRFAEQLEKILPKK